MQNKYEIIEIVGEGAFGIVMKCKNRETGEVVAIKKFKDSEDEIVQKSMLRELKVLRKLKHENIVGLKECFRRKGKLYLVFEFVERNLLQVIEENPNGLDQNLLKRIIYQLCKSVTYIHVNDTLHRDIKPENILITSDYIVKVCDFGFARSVPQKGGILTDYVATRWYRAPELLLASTNYGKEVDYWAIGCIMGELADGQPMFPGDTEFNVLILIQKLLGNFPATHLEMFYSNPRYVQEKLDNVSKPETLERRYFGKLNKSGIIFMKSLLKLDWRERLSSNDIMMHSYFEDVRSEDPEFSHLKNISNTNNINNNNNSKIVIKGGTRSNKFINSGMSNGLNTGTNTGMNAGISNGNNTGMNTGLNTKNNFYPNNNSKSPSNDMNSNSKLNNTGKQQQQLKFVPKKNSIHNGEINKDTSNNFNNTNQGINQNNNNQGSNININFYKTNYKSIYNLNENKDDVYNFDIDTKFDDKVESSNYNPNSNSNSNSNTNANINPNAQKKKKSNLGNLVIIEEEKINKKMNETRLNRFKPDTGADFYEEEVNNNKMYNNNSSPKNAIPIQGKKPVNVNKIIIKEESPDNKNFVNAKFLPHLPHISTYRGFDEYSKKIKK